MMSGRNPWSTPQSTARVRLSTPIFRYAVRMYFLTELMLVKVRSAISSLFRPWVISAMTSASRALSP